MKRINVSFILIIWVLMVSPLLVTAGERTILDGIVNTTKDTSGNIVAIKLNLAIEGEKVFHVVLDKTGKQLGIAMDGQWVVVIGDVYDKGGVVWIEVKSYKNYKETIFE